MSVVARWSFSADGNGASVIMRHTKSNLEIEAVGDFGGGTAKLQKLGEDGATWYDIPGASLTSSGAVGGLRASSGATVRAVLSGSTSPDLLVTILEDV